MSTSNSNEVIKVFIRLRPPLSHELESANVVQCVDMHRIAMTGDKHKMECAYDQVFNEVSSQDDVYNAVMPLLNDVLHGINGCVFAYGVTSSGKTHTMLGPDGGRVLTSPAQWGLLPRATQYIFDALADTAQEADVKSSIKASYLQIYNENIYDLLSTTNNTLKLRELPKKPNAISSEVYVSGLSEYSVHSAADVLKILHIGSNNRETRATHQNETSSRSHAILQLNFDLQITTHEQTIMYKSKLSLVDLAGSEKMPHYDTATTSVHVKELTSINKSLSSLGNVIYALSRHKHKKHVPYRDSKLTRLLQDSLGGNTRTILIACIAPTAIQEADTFSTLQFADRAKSVMIRVKANLIVDDKALLMQAQAEIARLKLLLKQALQTIECHGLTLTSADANTGTPAASGGIDGETREELARVLNENKKLRRDNFMLRNQLKLAPQLPKKVKHKKDFDLRNNLDVTANRPVRKQPPAAVYSSTESLNPYLQKPALSEERSRRGNRDVSDQQYVSSTEQRLREAIRLNATIGSPVSKYATTAKNTAFFPSDSGDSGDAETYSDDEFDTAENPMSEIEALRQTLLRAQNAQQAKVLEQRLQKASASLESKLEQETSHLSRIQQQRAQLEEQLARLHDAPQSPVVKPTASSSVSSLRDVIAAAPSPSPPKPPTGLLKSNFTDSNNKTSQKAVSNIPLQLQQLMKGNTTVTTSVPSPDKKKDMYPPADLTFSKADATKAIQMYSFRYDSWEDLAIEDFEPSNSMHKCKNLNDGSVKWLDLKKKPIRGVPVTVTEKN